MFFILLLSMVRLSIVVASSGCMNVVILVHSFTESFFKAVHLLRSTSVR